MGRDRVASLAARLGEFLDRYEATAAHHHHHQQAGGTQQVGADCNNGQQQQELKVVDSQVFDDFLVSARSVCLSAHPFFRLVFFTFFNFLFCCLLQ